MCDNLDIVTLASVAALKHQWQQLIGNHHIKRKYHLNTGRILIRTDLRTTSIEYQPTVNPMDVRVVCNGYNDTLAVIKAFGHIFTNFKVEISLEEGMMNNVKQLVLYIGKHCNTDHDVLINGRSSFSLSTEVFKMVFPRATKVQLNQFHHYHRGPLELLTTFPCMESLVTDSTLTLELNRRLPRLRHFTTLENNPPEFTQFLECNPGLHSFYTDLLSDHRRLHKLSKLQPDLRSLHITYWWSSAGYLIEEPMRFPNVRHFTLNVLHLLEHFSEEMRHNLLVLQFDRLKTMKLKTSDMSEKRFLLEFIARYQTLETVEIETLSLNRSDLMQLVESLAQLDTLKIRISKRNDVKELHSFFEEATTLNRVVVSKFRSRKLEDYVLLENLPEQWQFIRKEHEAPLEYFIFERVQEGE